MSRSRETVARRSPGAWMEVGGVALLVVFSAAAAAGYAVFGHDPGRVAALGPEAARFYGVSFGLFSRGQVLLAAAVLGVAVWRVAGWRWLPALGAVYAASLGSELLGTMWGVPFGSYAYTSLLGVKWLGLVPVLIPLSWFLMAVPSYGLARWAVGGRGAIWRVLTGSLLLLAWDLVLDPAMSEVTRYWVWAERGPYYGMPLTNLFGWYVTGLVLMALLEALSGREWVGALSPRWLAAFYGANLLLPVGLVAAAGLWGAVLAPAVVLAAVAVGAPALRGRGTWLRLVPSRVASGQGGVR